MTPFPRSARIGPFNYRIRWSTSALKKLGREHGPLYGFCDTEQQVIYCAKSGVHHDQAVDTLLHELLHAALHVGRGPSLSEKTEEGVVLALAPVLLGLLRDNPHIVEFLTEEIQ